MTISSLRRGFNMGLTLLIICWFTAQQRKRKGKHILTNSTSIFLWLTGKRISSSSLHVNAAIVPPNNVVSKTCSYRGSNITHAKKRTNFRFFIVPSLNKSTTVSDRVSQFTVIKPYKEIGDLSFDFLSFISCPVWNFSFPFAAHSFCWHLLNINSWDGYLTERLSLSTTVLQS